MTRLAEIQRHVASMAELLEIVGAMRSLAGMRMQEAQRALPGIRRYADSMADAIGAALSFLPPAAAGIGAAGGRRAVILYAAEHGFVGGFNKRLIEAAAATLDPSDRLFVMGARGAALAAERGLPVAWTHPMATRLAGAPDTADGVAGEFYRRIARGEISRVEVIFGRYRQGAEPTVENRALLPVEIRTLAARKPSQAPLRNLEPGLLLEKLMAEYVFALTTEATVESIVSENAARFAAMESAHDNVTKKLAALRGLAGQARQAEITSELLDLVTGAEAARTTANGLPGRDTAGAPVQTTT